MSKLIDLLTQPELRKNEFSDNKLDIYTKLNQWFMKIVDLITNDETNSVPYECIRNSIYVEYDDRLGSYEIWKIWTFGESYDTFIQYIKNEITFDINFMNYPYPKINVVNSIELPFCDLPTLKHVVNDKKSKFDGLTIVFQGQEEQLLPNNYCDGWPSERNYFSVGIFVTSEHTSQKTDK